jgi:putative transposase
MRVEPYTVGSYLHVIKRGARGIDIVRDESDRWRFLRMLFLLNDEHFDRYWRDVELNGIFDRPTSLPPQQPIVEVLAYTLMPNHFHLLLREIKSGGVTLFMKRVGQSLTNHANEKYKEKGSLFQGAYRSKTILEDEYLRYVAAYVMVKNTFELYPNGGLIAGVDNFDKVWDWAREYNFSSLGDYAGVRKTSPLLNKGILGEIYTPDSFKVYAKDVILGGKWKVGVKELE